MSGWICHVEGVNFTSTLMDTKDLSTVRGSSLALLKLDQLALAALEKAGFQSIDRVFSGASECAFQFDATGSQTDIQTRLGSSLEAAAQADDLKIPFKHLSFVSGVASLASNERANIEKALKLAKARALAAQFRQWTVPPVPFDAKVTDSDAFDDVRPGVADGYLPKDKTRRQDAKLSHSVAARRAYGKKQRQAFYSEELQALGGKALLEGFTFTDSIEDIVDDAPTGLAKSLGRKVALIYADGNGFGEARNSLGTKPFSDQLKAMRNNLLKAIVTWLVEGAGNDDARIAQAFVKSGNELRFETVLWGGDEMAFVMPAWLATAFVEGFFNLTKDWKIGGVPLTHALGVVIANAKTPIRQLQHIAKEAADLAKEQGIRDENSVTFEIFESLSPPDVSIEPMRKQLYGLADEYEVSDLKSMLALPGASLGQTLAQLEAVTGTDGEAGFPRSQLYGALRKMRARTSSLSSPTASRAAAEELELYARRAGRHNKEMQDNLRLPVCRIMKSRPRELALDLIMVAHLWDYADPLEGQMPRLSLRAGGAA